MALFMTSLLEFLENSQMAAEFLIAKRLPILSGLTLKR